MIVYIGTTNDSNGNPRRGWIVDYESADSYFIDEGYEGRQALAAYKIEPRAGDLPKIDVTPGEYRYWVKREAPTT